MKFKKIPPAFKIFAYFLAVILIGFLLFLLPISVKDGVSIKAVDALFTSFSAVCVTGLSTIPNMGATLSIFGKIVLTILIQIGGLGFITVAVFIMVFLGMKIGVIDRYLIKEALNQNSSKGIVRLIKSIILTSFIIEGIGAIGYFIVFIQDFSFGKALGMSFFHSISAFNNCGFDLLGSSSFIGYKNNIILNITTTLLIILGGIGFIVIQDVITNRKWSKLSIHSRIVLPLTGVLIVGGTLLLKASEGFVNSNFTWMQAFFQSVTTRTAGFSTVNIGTLNTVSILIIAGFMFIGASPSSTGGGIKTTTFFTMFKSIVSFSRGEKTITYDRWISEDTKLRAFTLTTLSITAIFIVTMALMAIENNNPLYDVTLQMIFFEATSAFGTVGLSLGITPMLLSSSKIMLSFLMLFGRLGPLTIFSLWNRNWNRNEVSNVRYVEEKIILG
ncbi:MAG TPA: potassium transporter TrkG [Bacilli bacterium]|nr:potassium transporter TrkG [Bacilli bacterium]